MRSFIILLFLIPTLLFARQSQLKTLLEQAIKGKKAEIGIAVYPNEVCPASNGMSFSKTSFRVAGRPELL